jgi:hypothetical protein
VVSISIVRKELRTLFRLIVEEVRNQAEIPASSSIIPWTSAALTRGGAWSRKVVSALAGIVALGIRLRAGTNPRATIAINRYLKAFFTPISPSLTL